MRRSKGDRWGDSVENFTPREADHRPGAETEPNHNTLDTVLGPSAQPPVREESIKEKIQPTHAKALTAIGESLSLPLLSRGTSQRKGL